ncbi:MAG TPA: EAL domain-containing protein, partial [Solirubrobacteraceae bacterium]|nr:EAL domain-containing protein [Solirubrobacteraceae bacterium]
MTETSTVDLAMVVPALDALREAGLILSLDDFGTGYSSLGRLRDMPFSLLKTDLSFMRGIPSDPGAVELMQSIISLGRGGDRRGGGDRGPAAVAVRLRLPGGAGLPARTSGLPRADEAAWSGGMATQARQPAQA